MSGSWWRLLAAFSLILATPLVVGQDTAIDRSSTSVSSPPEKRSPPTNVPPIGPIRVPERPNLPPHYPRISSPGAFRQMIRAAGIIFSGRVTFIGQTARSSRPDAASTAITFQVEHAIRGTSTGQSLTIREWAGLWTNGERYRVGQRVLLFLYSPSKLGLTSPVAGGMGRFAMDSQGQVVMGAQDIVILEADPILGGKTVVPYADFALAVGRSIREE
jgi:hypothetical protein